METEEWLRYLPQTCQLLITPGLLCQAVLHEKLEEIAAEFVWLDEIYEEAVGLFSIKRAKLEQMPKTPSMKRKGGKTKYVKVKDEADDDQSPVNNNNKGAPTKLKFESPKNLSSNNETLGGRPLRNCRVTTKASYIDESELPKRSTRQSKKPRNSQVSNCSPYEDQRHSVQKPASSATVKLEAESVTDSVTKVKSCTSTIAKQKSEEKSPSVRDRTKAYESMLKMRVSGSPVSKHSGQAGANKVAHSVSEVVSAPPKGQMSGQSPQLERGQPASGTSATQSSEISVEADGARPTRTRLKLKKQKQQEEEMDIGVSRQLDVTQGLARNPSIHVTTDNGSRGQQSPDDHREILNETETVITEIYDIMEKGQPAKLREFEIVQTKTTPVCERVRPLAAADCVSDQGFNDGDMESTQECSDDSHQLDRASRDHKMKQAASSTQVVTTEEREDGSDGENRGRRLNKDSGVVSEIVSKADSTFVKEDKSTESKAMVTRTRTRAEKETVSHETPAERMTRTRQRKQEEVQKTSQDLKPARVVPMEAQPPVLESCAMTRSRMKKALDPNKLAICGSDDEIIAGSPVVGTLRTSLRGAKKRLADERGLSPRPKRSCVGDESSLNIRSPPQSTSSPLKRKDALLCSEDCDKVASPRRSPRAFKFNSAQKVTSGFLNRTPGFGQNTSKLCSFLSNTPTCRNTSFLTSFLKRNTPPPKQNNQILQEQKRQKMLEKENRDMERLKRAADLRKRRIEDQKRMREEKEHKVAEAREERLRNEQEYKNRINKKFEDKATLKVKLMEERIKEEREKQKQRLRKQMEADTRRKCEEEERLKKFLEQEEEAKMHEEFMQRKKEFEEAERRRQIAEEKRKQEERLAELEQKRQEESTRLRLAEEEKDRDRERIRLEKEKQTAQERAERERTEREKREDKDRKIQEEMDKLKAMEKERLRCQQEKLQQQKQEEVHQNVIRQMINKHNSSLSKQPAGLNSSTAGNTSSSKISSYEITPVKEKFVSKNKCPDNYDIEDKGSDDSTDDEEAPKKRIPEWATGIPLNTALIRQHMNPPDVEVIFQTHRIEPPNLVQVFPGKKRLKYTQRTSSAIWNSPPMSRH